MLLRSRGRGTEHAVCFCSRIAGDVEAKCKGERAIGEHREAEFHGARRRCERRRQGGTAIPCRSQIPACSRLWTYVATTSETGLPMKRKRGLVLRVTGTITASRISPWRKTRVAGL